MDWVKLTSINVFKKNVLDVVDWSQSFIREISLVSPSYVLPDGHATVAPDCLPSARVFISSLSEDVPGIELLFIEVEDFFVWFGGDLNPNVEEFYNSVKWEFNDSITTPITCKSLYYRFLDSGSWGKNLRYGWEDVYDTGGELAIL